MTKRISSPSLTISPSGRYTFITIVATGTWRRTLLDDLGEADLLDRFQAARAVLTRTNGWAMSIDPQQEPARLAGSVLDP